MSQQELLRKVVGALEDLRCPYMLTGSFASSLHGEPRLSHEIDLVVDMDSAAIPHLAGRFPPPEYLLDKGTMEEAVSARSVFNLLHVVEGDKVDFWLLTDDPFDETRFRRRRAEDVLGLRLFVSTPEDTILAKLRWAKLSRGSEKQFYDALRVYEVQRDVLDMTYVGEWVAQLGLEEYWVRVQRESHL